MYQIHGLKERKVAFRISENETKIDLVLIKKEHGQFVQNVKAISSEFQHTSVVADIDN